jgi:hypothetical protein
MYNKLTLHKFAMKKFSSLPIRSFASGTHLEKFDFLDPLKL